MEFQLCCSAMMSVRMLGGGIARIPRHRHLRDDPREDVDEDVGIGVGVVEFGLRCTECVLWF